MDDQMNSSPFEAPDLTLHIPGYQGASSSQVLFRADVSSGLDRVISNLGFKTRNTCPIWNHKALQ